MSLELLSKGRCLADECQEELYAVLLGGEVSYGEECLLYGADKVYHIISPLLEEYSSLYFTDSLCNIFTEIKANIVLIGASPLGRDLAPRVSVRLKTGLTADCTALEMKKNCSALVDPEKILLMTRPAFGENLLASIVCPEQRPQMATVRQGVFSMLKEHRKGLIVYLNYQASFTDRVQIIETIYEENISKSIEKQELLVVGGRGVSETMYKKLTRLAELLGGGLGVSRGLVEEHIAPYEIQVGQTGKTVQPEIMLSFGVSGAIQHITGMEKSHFIISINKDKNAPIFQFSHLGFICSLEEVIEALIKKLEKNQKTIS